MSLQIGNESLPSIVKDPFNKNSVKRISVFYREGYNGTWDASGTVTFENGNTKGEQTFQGDTFDQVTLQIKAFINTL